MMLPAIIQANNDNLSVPLIYIEVAILMFGAFMIGYFFAYYYQKRNHLQYAKLHEAPCGLGAASSVN